MSESVVTTTHPDIDDPTFRRRLADIVHDATQLADAVDRAIPCDYDRHEGDRRCWRTARWLLTVKRCRHTFLMCQTHRDLIAALALAWVPLICPDCDPIEAPLLDLADLDWQRI